MNNLMSRFMSMTILASGASADDHLQNLKRLLQRMNDKELR